MTFAVVACSECNAYLILDYADHDEPDAKVECPKCGTTHRREQLRVLNTADSRDTACELRAQQLAEEAGDTGGFTTRSSGSEEFIRNSGDSVPTTSETTELDSIDTRGKENNAMVPETHDNSKDSEQQITPAVRAKKQYIEVLEGLFRTPVQQGSPVWVDEIEHDRPNHPNSRSDEPPSLSDIVELSPPDEAGLTPTSEPVVSKTLTLTGHNTISTVWQEFVENNEIQRYFLRAARNAVENRTFDETTSLLDSIGISDTPQINHYPRGMIRDLKQRPGVAEAQAAILLEIIQDLGNPPSTIQDILSMAELFQFANQDNSFTNEEVEVPIVSVQIENEEFTSLDRPQRTDICELLTTLSKAMDLHLVTTQATQRYLRDNHREDLPGVSDWEIGHHNARIDEALTELDVDGAPVDLLRTFQQETDDTLSYADLHESFEISNSRVRQCILELQDYGLIETFGPQKEKKVKLLEPGCEVLSIITDQFSLKTTLDNSENSTPNYERHKRGSGVHNSRDEARRPEAAVHSNNNSTDTTAETGSNYSTEYLCEENRDAIAACGIESGAVTIVDDGIENVESKTQFIAVDTDREEIVVSGHATNPLEYTVANAVALAHPKLIGKALTDETLETVLTDVRPSFLRNAREIGYLTDEVLTDADSFRELFVTWGEDIKKLTWRIRNNGYGNGEFDDQADLAGEICQQAHGLAGSIIHVLDEAGFDVIRDIRVPAGVNSAKLEALAESVAHSMLIQSHYKGFSAFRQLYEDREDYRARSFNPKVDAADPTGTFIGSMVVRGGSATRLVPALASELQSYEPHEDAPEFTIPIRIQRPTRETVTVAATRVLNQKNIRLTENAVSVLDAVVDSPFDVVHALEQLDSEREPRDITSVDLRYVLQYLAADDVLSGLPRSVGKIMMSLFEAAEPLSQAELADRADVTGQTIRNHGDPLLQSGLARLDEKSSGKKEWRASLPFPHEHGRTVFPNSCSESLASVVSDMVEIEGHRCECSGNCVNAVLEGGLNDLTESCPVSRWGRVCASLSNSEVLRDQGQVLNRITMGIKQKQTAIGEFASGADEETFASEEVTNEIEHSNADHGSDDTDNDDDCEFDFSDVSIEGSGW